jgi:hypothetical protein
VSTDVETATAGVGETRPEAAAGDLALLERHKPLLRFDRQYDYRLASVLGMVENPGNLLRTADGEVIARVGGDPPLTRSPERLPTGEPSPATAFKAPDVPARGGWSTRPSMGATSAGRSAAIARPASVLVLPITTRRTLRPASTRATREMIQIAPAAMASPIARLRQHDSRGTQGDRGRVGERAAPAPGRYVRRSHASYFESARIPTRSGSTIRTATGLRRG